jgi:hypothetical protein
MKDRPKPIGFWKYPTRGVRTPSKEFMTELLSSQQKGLVTGDSSRLRLNAGKITKQYPETVFPGHSAWIDWPWKLHRIEESGQITVELYDLEKDAQETINLAKQINDRTQRMMAELEQWLVSVVKSLNGEDY